ncbi:MAG: LemA family protein [Clostridia bacterium]|nr:LemA family protein [Clostridia bacterium]
MEVFFMTIIVLVILAVIVLWFIGVQRKLVAMDENINNAMSQIGVQLSSRWDALTALLDLTKGYAEHEYKTLSDTIKMRTSISSKSTAAEVNEQENILTDALGKIMAVAESYPDLKANENYIKTMDSVNAYEEMVRKSRLVYNDSVTKLNRTIRMFPTSIAAGILNITSRDYLETNDKKADMPDMR